MDADRLLADLDADQRAAVTTPSTLVAVIAAAGSGKTRVLTRRIAYRIAVGTADAAHTLALTFTREAAGELRRRLRQSGLREPVEAGTFHSIALGVLRQRWADTDRPVPTIINDPERLLAEVADGVPVEVLRAERDWLAARGVDASRYCDAAKAANRRSGPPPERIAEALDRYEQLKRRRGVIDLDDLVPAVGGEIGSDGEFAALVRWRFRQVLVDEAQDLNPAQYHMLRAITGERNDLFLVGDPAQAIYGFNGSDPALLTHVERHLPGIEVVRLPTNHRCTPQIVAAGEHVLAATGPVEPVRSGRDQGPAIDVVTAADEHDEARRVADYVRGLSPQLTRAGRVGVLARTHQQLADLRRAFAHGGVPTQRDALAAGTSLSAAVRAVALLRSASQLRAWAHDVLDVPAPTPGARDSDVASAERRVASVVLDYLRESPLGDGAGFRSWVATARPFAEAGDEEGAELLTFHAAKGREWHTVVVTGVETGLVPHRTATTVEARAEEARLLHVAFTRASDRLLITRAERRRGYARRPSPFLAGIADAVAAAAAKSPVIAAPQPLHDAGAASRRARQVAESVTAWRDAVARANAMLPQQICSDDELAAIAVHPPTTPDELAAITGFGPVTAARHFAPLRAALDGVS